MEKCDSQPGCCEGPQAETPLRPFSCRKDLRMAAKEEKPRARGWTKAARAAFLAKLAETANVAASAREARMPVSSVYALRLKSPEFRFAWGEALAEGYARLEASLLEAALGKARGTADPDTLKREAARHRLGLSLLAQHRPAVKGMTSLSRPADARQLRARIMDRIALMHQRIETAKADDAPNG